ncbi:GNAT family N-acetyltransferase [Polluticoccus soli]|uniref:GNAT family N-acetyltransferase n=1 Tax=Polluticoccus soli TaxID=3034150 RepID=UPI0023E12E5E|nr:GNAT family N-acetyltransferase [Flavipsychrobacter sp. JY13-12]
MNFEIRQATPADAATLANLGAKVFYNAFADFSTPEDMQLYLAETFTEEKLREEFEEPSVTYYVAYADDQPAGFAKLTKKRTPEALHNLSCIELERLYVHPDFQNRKIGHGLMQQCIETARAQENKVLWLGVSEHNPGAIRLYERWGFKKFGEHIFQLGNDPQTDWLMRLDL